MPRDVIYYSVPQPLVLQIGPPPSGYRYVRVASDILMIAIGTGMVVDAIQDLGRQQETCSSAAGQRVLPRAYGLARIALR
jgi:hypothetical protein